MPTKGIVKITAVMVLILMVVHMDSSVIKLLIFSTSQPYRETLAKATTFGKLTDANADVQLLNHVAAVPLVGCTLILYVFVSNAKSSSRHL